MEIGERPEPPEPRADEVVMRPGAVGICGSEVTRSMAIDLVRPGGRVVCIGLAADATTLPFHTVVREQITIIGSYAYTMADFEQSLEWLASGRASLGDLPPVLPLDEGPEMFARLAEAPPDQIKIFLAGAGRTG